MSLTYDTPLKLLALEKGFVVLPNETYGQATIGPYESATTFNAFPFPDSKATAGEYLLQAGESCLGRAQMEDLSLRPKSVVSVPGMDEGTCSVMVVDREYENGFTMKVGNGSMFIPYRTVPWV